MEAPYTIATLPTPLDAASGTIQALPVFGIRGSKKRKRHEVAVGVDGESLDIYDIQSQDRVTSYALPPNTNLCCSPCSVYIRKQKSAGATRLTYLVLRNGGTKKKRRLVCFTENVQRGGGLLDGYTGPSRLEHKLAGGDVYGVDVLGTEAQEDKDAVQVLVSHVNGAVNCLTADLSQSLWTHDGNDKQIIEYSMLTDMDTARKGLLAGRDDVLATLAAGPGSSANTPLLCRILRIGNKRSLQLFSVRPRALDAIQSQNPGLQHLVDYELPATSKYLSEGSAKFEVHPASGKAYQLLKDRLTVYDLSGTLPRILTTFGSNSTPISGFGRVSASVVLAVQGDNAVVYETRYGAMQGTVALGPSSAATGQKRKREEADAASHPEWMPISYFQDSGLIAGLCGTELMAIQLSDDVRQPKRRGIENTLLVDVIGKGTSIDVTQAGHNVMNEAKKLQKWETWKSSVDSAVAGNDDRALESLLMRVLKPIGDISQHTQRRGEISGSEDESEDEFDMSSVDVTAVDRKKIVYILSKVFETSSDASVERTKSGRLQAIVDTKLVYRLLAFSGFLTLSLVQQATRGQGNALQPGDIAVAIVALDDTFVLLRDLLAAQAYWETPELVQALRLLIKSLVVDIPEGLPGMSKLNGDVDMVNGDVESHVESELARVEHYFQMASASLDNGVEVKSGALRLVLDRLMTSPQGAVTKAMRTLMTQNELFLLLRLLRTQLLSGGWHRNYVQTAGGDDAFDSGEPTPGTLESGSRAMESIGVLTSAAIDAVGLSGWLVGQSAAVVETRQFMQEMKNEVSASMEGLFEHRQLATFLDEVDRLNKMAKSGGKRERLGAELAKHDALTDGGLDMFGGFAETTLEREQRVLPIGRRVAAPPVLGANKKNPRIEIAERRARVGYEGYRRIKTSFALVCPSVCTILAGF
ncbi:hypothetical protein LTR17_000610 [Elasticomyces elasticus]|nr:hypothetical protein LTR17_000610 [Elasticomyces elasticus]